MKKLLACVFALALSSTAFAQETTTTSTEPTVTTTTGTDGEMMVGRFGLGVISGTTVALPQFDNAGNITGTSAVAMPIIGVRYWLPGMGGEGALKRIGVDVGLGLAIAGGSSERPNPAGGTINQDANSLFGFGLHVGAPLVLGASKHVNFQIVPELSLAYVSESQPDVPNVVSDQSVSNLALSIGGRGGFEVFFGFVGIPELSLEASVGLDYTLNSLSGEATPAGGTKFEASASDWSIGTRAGNEPWDIFTGNIAARYYF